MRILVRVLAGLFGLGLAVVGALLAVEVVWAWLWPADSPLLVPWPRWRARLDELTWQRAEVRLVAGALVGVGLVLLLIAATARRRDVRLREPAAEVSVVTSPRSLARIVGRRVRAQDNVTFASVTATPKTIRVRAAGRLETDTQLRPRLLDVAKATVDDLPLVRTPRVRVVVISPRGRHR
jgi:hypothetical protein